MTFLEFSILRGSVADLRGSVAILRGNVADLRGSVVSKNAIAPSIFKAYSVFQNPLII